MKKLNLIFIALLLQGLVSNLFAQNSPNEVLPFDSQVLKGQLENGLTYYIRENHKPEKRIFLYLEVKAGSVHEDDDQQGLAHFTEHMAFNGTKNFPKSEVYNFIQRKGITNWNGGTTYDRTIYYMQIPTDSQTTIDSAFTLLSDIAYNVSFDSLEIEKERGVILEEAGYRLGAEGRMQQQYIPIWFKGSPFANRIPIGKNDVIKNCSRETFLRFYHNWYRPELMGVFVVGDYPTQEMEKLVKKYFGTIPKSQTPLKITEYSLVDNEQPLISIVSDKESTSQYVEFTTKQKFKPLLSYHDFRKSLAQQLYTSMLNSRLNELSQKLNTPFNSGWAYYGGFYMQKQRIYSFGASTKENQIKESFSTLLAENERVRRFGFTPTELERQKRNLLSEYEKRFKEKDKTESQNLVWEYEKNFLEGNVCIGAEKEYQLAKEYVSQIKLEEVNTIANEWISDKNILVLVKSPQKEGITLPTESEILQLMTDTKKANLKPYVDISVNAPLLEKKPKSSKIISRKENADLNCTEIILENGVHLFLKPTNFKSNQILIQGFSKGGTWLYPDKDIMSLEYLKWINESGVGKFNSIDLSKLLSGNTADVDAYVDETEEGIKGSCSPKDLETMLQLTYLKFTEPRKDTELFEVKMTKEKTQSVLKRNNPDNLFSDTIAKITRSNSPRVVRYPTVNQLNNVKLDRMYEIYKERFADASDFNFVIVGNFKPDSILPLLQTYLGGLPALNRNEKIIDRTYQFPNGITNFSFSKNSDKQSNFCLIMRGDFDYSYTNAVKFSLFERILLIRLDKKIREELGGTYSIGAWAWNIREPKNRYEVQITFKSSAEKTDTLIQCTFEELKKLREQGASNDEINKAKSKAIREYEENQTDNDWWLNRLKDYATYREIEPQKYADLVNSITQKDLQEMAQKYITLDHYVKGVLLPEKK